MEDPRDNPENEEILTEDSDDEYKDLLKEYEAKFEKIKQKKKLKESKSTEILSDDEDELKPTKEQTPVDSVIQPKVKASNFVEKLHAVHSASSSRKTIDYNARKFTFADIELIKMGDIQCDEMDSLSGQYLRKRYIPSNTLVDIIKKTDPNMKVLKIDKLLAKVHRGNNYEDPNYTNWCLVGFVIKKNQAKVTKDSKKFMKLKIGDFNRSVDVLLFGKAHDEYWKIREGNAVIILNPVVNKYSFKGRERDIEGFNFKLDNFNLGLVIEYGCLRDYGTCTAIRKSDNQKCEEIINIKRTTLCDFHIDQRFKSNQNRRMELNSGGGAQMRSPTKNRQAVYMNKNGSVAFTKDSPQYNEDTRVYHFLSAEAKSRYYDPKLLTAKVEKRRKVMDEKANQALKEKLMTNLANHSKLKSLNLINDTHAPTKSGQSFSQEMVSKIGYDPTMRGDTDVKQRSNNKVIEELNALSSEKAKTRSLDSATKDVQLKKQRWKTNIETSKSYNEQVMKKLIDKTPLETVTKPLIPVRNKKNRIIEDEIDLDSSDSEIEIEFDTKEMETAFKNRVR